MFKRLIAGMALLTASAVAYAHVPFNVFVVIDKETENSEIPKSTQNRIRNGEILFWDIIDNKCSVVIAVPSQAVMYQIVQGAAPTEVYEALNILHKECHSKEI